jgi:cellobiose phosphorylase
MDHGIWPYLALRSYIHKSGDLGILLNESTYFKDHQIKRAKGFDANFSSKDHCLRNSAGRIYEGSVLEHVLVQNLTQFFNVGNHNIVRLENADWNDGLDMAAQYGESVALSFMYAHNLRDLCALLERLKNKITTLTVLKELSLLLDRLDNSINYNRFREKQERLEKYLEKTKNISGKKIKINIDDLIYDLKEKSKHLSKWIAEREWLREGFFNGYYDNKSRRVEGKIKNKIQMMLSPQVFAIMSGVATEKQIQKIWFSIKRYLQDKKLEGFHLNTDFGSVYLDLGRAFGFSYGDKENGAFFNHMVVMLAYALYKKGFIKEGFEVINSIYKMATNLKGEIYPVIPEYFNNEGKGLYLYLTGSASWYVYTLLEEILGIKFILGDLAIEPKLIYANFFNHKIKVRFALGDKIVETLYIIKNKKNTPYKIENVFLGTREIFQQGNKFLIKKEDFKTLKKKEVGLRVYLS